MRFATSPAATARARIARTRSMTRSISSVQRKLSGELVAQLTRPVAAFLGRPLVAMLKVNGCSRPSLLLTIAGDATLQRRDTWLRCLRVLVTGGN